MPTAMNTDTTSPPLPASVQDLGRQFRLLSAVIEENDKERLQDRSRVKFGYDRKEALAQARQYAISDLMATLPAQTIADAAFQLGVAWEEVCVLVELAPTPEEQIEIVQKLKRFILSVLPLVAEAAGLAVTDVADEGIIDRYASEFPVLEVAI